MEPDEVQIFVKGIEGKTSTIEIHKVYITWAESENNRENRLNNLRKFWPLLNFRTDPKGDIEKASDNLKS